VVNASNTEIMNLLDNQKWILQIDPMILFYCIYFTVYYRNQDVYEFLKTLITSLNLTENNNKKKADHRSNKTSIKNEFDKTH